MTPRMSHIFGPVPSRRLGISLGVDIIPYKVCTLDCIYCECGKTTDLSLERRHFIDPAAVLDELRTSLAAIPHLDYITFSGSGEPTLNADIGLLIREIKKMTAFPVAVLTNGTLLYREEVRRELSAADLVLPSLDAVGAAALQRINQPHSGLDFALVLDGLERFRREYSGRLWLEVFLVKGGNDDQQELAALHQAIRRIAPDRVQLNTLDRPPAYPGVESADMAALEAIRRQWSDLPVEITKRVQRREEILSFSLNLENSILNTIRRRPLTREDLQALTGLNQTEIRQYLDVLEKEKKVRPRIVGDKIFYSMPETGRSPS